jgi:hypothetical protein
LRCKPTSSSTEKSRFRTTVFYDVFLDLKYNFLMSK